MSVAAATGITGQDSSYLRELLLNKGFVDHGLVRRSNRTRRTSHDSLSLDKTIYNRRLFLHYADLEDTTSMRRILIKTQPVTPDSVAKTSVTNITRQEFRSKNRSGTRQEFRSTLSRVHVTQRNEVRSNPSSSVALPTRQKS